MASLPVIDDTVRLSVVVPCFNEAAGLRLLYEQIVNDTAQTDVELELILVNDGSRDDTLAVMRDLHDTDKRVRYISLSRNFGKESAMLAGLRRAGGDAVVIMDADLQHPPSMLPDMVAAYRRGAHQVVSRRERTGDPWQRTVTARAFYRLSNAFVDVSLTDGVGDFRLLSRRALTALLELGECNRFSKGLFSWIGFETVYLPMKNARRAAGRSTWSYRRLLNYAVDGVISFNNKPLRAAIYVGLPVTMIAVGYMIFVIAAAVIGGRSTPGYVTIVTAIIGFGGLQMLLLGIMGEYLGRVYYETKRRPHYIVEEADDDQPGHGSVR